MVVQMRYKEDGLKWCLVNQSGMGSEFTACGNAIPDSTMKNEGCEFTGKENEHGKITCLNCRHVVKFYKSVKL